MADRWFIGKFDEIKYGFRTAVDKNKGTVDTAGYASDLGGVYGIFRDNTYLYYATFGKNIYNKKSDLKGKVEGAAGKYILVKAGKPLKSTNLFVQEVYFIEDIKQGIFYKGPKWESDKKGGLKEGSEWKLDLTGIAGHQDEETFGKLEDLRKSIRDCTECDQAEYCKQPVPFSTGDFQAMIVGMDPGKEEDESGVPLIGASGKALWDGLGLDRQYFHVTNTQKCKHEGKDLDKFKAQCCADRWLQKEIEIVKPKLILSLGGHALHWLSGDKKALIFRRLGMEDSESDIGRCVEWNKSLECWVMYALHPSWAMYGKRMNDWKESIKGFRKMFLRLI